MVTEPDIAPSETSGSSSLKSLLSLAGVASTAVPIAIPSSLSPDDTSFSPPSSFGASSYSTTASSSLSTTSSTKLGHRRLPSRSRRLSDARDAAFRPAPSPPTLAGLSLSASSPGSSTPTLSPESPTMSEARPVPIGATPIPIGKSKKRGVDFKCESCSKIYRHPSCLIKHRWEHTPHWRESSKYVLSKHQQVQLLEAAAILSHLGGGETGKSLPEDRSLWPSFLSGGSLPGPGEVPQYQHKDSSPRTSTRRDGFVSTQTVNGFTISSGVSSSVPSTSLLSSRQQQQQSQSQSAGAGPRMHDYEIRPGKGGVGVITRNSVKKEEETPDEFGYGVIGRGRRATTPSSVAKGKAYHDYEFTPSDDEQEQEDEEMEDVGKKEEVWDGMEMEMEMD